MHDRQGEPGDSPESVGYDGDDDIISLPDEPCDAACPASECCNDAELSHPVDNGGSDEERVIVLDKTNDSHLTIRYFDEEKDGRLEKQYRCVDLSLTGYSPSSSISSSTISINIGPISHSSGVK